MFGVHGIPAALILHVLTGVTGSLHAYLGYVLLQGAVMLIWLGGR
jgi:hypothetical protein